MMTMRHVHLLCRHSWSVQGPVQRGHHPERHRNAGALQEGLSEVPGEGHRVAVALMSSIHIKDNDDDDDDGGDNDDDGGDNDDDDDDDGDDNDYGDNNDDNDDYDDGDDDDERVSWLFCRLEGRQ